MEPEDGRDSHAADDRSGAVAKALAQDSKRCRRRRRRSVRRFSGAASATVPDERVRRFEFPV